MRFPFVAVVAVVLVACSARARSPAPQHVAIDAPIVEFLLTSAAADFHAHERADRFRDVRVGYVVMRDGEKLYLLCGEFLPAQATGQGEWTPFVTIKTSGYEQYNGARAASRCQRPSFIGNGEDLSSSLRSRFDAMH